VGSAPVDLSWLAGRGPVIEGRYALLIPGTSMTHGGAKHWPLERFVALAGILAARGLRPVVIGTDREASDAAAILAGCQAALDMTGKTSIFDLAGLSNRASLAVGGDTGPLHLAAMMGCPTIALFSRYSDPIQATPVGNTKLLRENRLEDLTVERVAAALP
jgi:ADP-heptose:LPS heptosyltransferase